METAKRKHPRLKAYDYGQNGMYFITVCAHEKRHLFAEIDANETVGRGLAPAEVQLSRYGKIAEEQLLKLEERYKGVKIDKYVIMPNHIHVLISLEEYAAGASPRPTEDISTVKYPTIPQIMCAYKSLTVKECRKQGFFGQLFQTSFYDHVIRDENDYPIKWRYIDETPVKWSEDDLF